MQASILDLAHDGDGASGPALVHPPVRGVSVDVPLAYDLAVVAVPVAILALVAWALLSLRGRATRMTGIVVLVWVLVIAFVPVVGALSWLLVGRRAFDADRDAEGSPPASQ